MKKLLLLAALLPLMSFQAEDTHYYIVTSSVQVLGKKVTQKNIAFEKCHATDTDFSTDGKNLSTVIYEMKQQGFLLDSHTSSTASTFVVDRLIFSKSN